jgi:RecQ family ATP-dependent DNA helicase
MSKSDDVHETREERKNRKYNKILKKNFGYDALKDLQFKIILNIIDGKDVVSLLPTSYGKSICYQMPYLITKKNVIVVSPLISLMEDQMRELKEKNIDAICLNSGNKHKNYDLNNIYSGYSKIIYTTPEYLARNNDFVEKLVEMDQLALIAIDECHCISNWGHSFRSDYKKLGFLKDVASMVPILALTATATDKVIQDVAKNLCLENPVIVKHSIDRPNLYLEIRPRVSSTLEQQIVPLLNDNKSGKTLIYCKTTVDTDKVAEKLQELGFKCESYHAKKNGEIRSEIQKEYTTGSLDIIVSTIAFGMGINIPDIRLMIHYNCSNDVESYLQEIGRAGRDGAISKCYMFYAPKDFALSFSFLSDITDEKIKAQKEIDISYLKKYVTTTECRRTYILKYFGENIFECSNCDNCLSKRYVRDFTKEVYLLFSLMSSIQSNLVMNNYIKLLLGSKDKKVIKYVDITKEYYGKGNTYSEEWWKKLFELLCSNKYLIEEKIKSDNKFMTYFVIKMTQKGSGWFAQYKHNDSGSKPKFSISIPDDFKKIDIKKEDKDLKNYKSLFGLKKFVNKDPIKKEAKDFPSDVDSDGEPIYRSKPKKELVQISNDVDSDGEPIYRSKPKKELVQISNDVDSDGEPIYRSKINIKHKSNKI